MSAPVLYSFRRCPYAMRARLGLAVAGITVELREILLRDKPADMLQRSPKGTVPVLVLEGGQVIDESRDVMLWALQKNDPQQWLARQEESLAVIDCNDTQFKPWLDRYKYFERHPEHPREFYLQQALEILNPWENKLAANDGGLVQKPRCLADYGVMPFVRQFARSDWATWENLPLPYMQAWLHELETGPLFTAIMKKETVWDQKSAGVTVLWQ